LEIVAHQKSITYHSARKAREVWKGFEGEDEACAPHPFVGISTASNKGFMGLV